MMNFVKERKISRGKIFEYHLVAVILCFSMDLQTISIPLQENLIFVLLDLPSVGALSCTCKLYRDYFQLDGFWKKRLAQLGVLGIFEQHKEWQTYLQSTSWRELFIHYYLIGIPPSILFDSFFSEKDQLFSYKPRIEEEWANTLDQFLPKEKLAEVHAVIALRFHTISLNYVTKEFHDDCNISLSSSNLSSSISRFFFSNSHCFFQKTRCRENCRKTF